MFYHLPQEVQVNIFLFDPIKREKFDRVVHQIKFLPIIGEIKWRKHRDGENFAHDYFFRPVKKIPWFKWQKERPEYMESIRKFGWNQYWSMRRLRKK